MSLLADISNPFREPSIHINGDYKYLCIVTGDINWYNGYEQIFYKDKLIYELKIDGLLID